MKIAIIGAGNLGRTLGSAWRTGGHDVTFGGRNPDDPECASLGSVRTNSAAAADVVVFDFSTLEVGLSSPGAEQVAGWATGARVCNHLALRGRS